MTFRQAFRKSKHQHQQPQSINYYSPFTSTFTARISTAHISCVLIVTSSEQRARAMAPPSVQLLRALRGTEVIRTSIPVRQQASYRTQHLLLRSARMRCIGTLPPHTRSLSTSPFHSLPPLATPNKSTDRGPKSTEDTQTDFGSMDVFSNAPAPTASIDACLSDGFHLDNGVKIGDGSGLLLVSGEAFAWRPWDAGGKGRLLNQRGQWDTGDGAWGVLDLVWPKPGMWHILFKGDKVSNLVS